MLSPEVTARLGRMLPSIAALCGCPSAECQQANPKREQGGQPSARLMGACHVILGYARGVARVLWLRAGVAIAGASAECRGSVVARLAWECPVAVGNQFLAIQVRLAG